MRRDVTVRRTGDIDEVGPFYWRVGRATTVAFLVVFVLLGVLVVTGVINRWFGVALPGLGGIRYLVYRYFGR